MLNIRKERIRRNISVEDIEKEIKEYIDSIPKNNPAMYYAPFERNLSLYVFKHFLNYMKSKVSPELGRLTRLKRARQKDLEYAKETLESIEGELKAIDKQIEIAFKSIDSTGDFNI